METEKIGGHDEYQLLSKKTADQLMESGEMEIVKEKYPELYKIKSEELKKEVNKNLSGLVDENIGSYDEFQSLSNKTAHQLMESGEMEIVQKKYPQLYKAKVEEIKKWVNGNPT
ncbi:MAG TPA: hypothetical protein DGG95_01995 [Cytophagales bacterium]|jgi:hypothetical protein|nr:hypothetical protein [Cytophagales bacterium]